MQHLGVTDCTGDIPDAIEICTTKTRDFVVVGPTDLAIYRGGERILKKELSPEENGRGVTFDPSGFIMITDNTRQEIQCPRSKGHFRLTPAARILRYDGKYEEGGLYLVTKCSHPPCRYQICPNGALLTSEELKNSCVSGVCCTTDFHVVLCDSPNGCLYVFRHGSFLRRIGSKGSGPNQFGEPQSLACTSANEIVVGDSFNRCVTLVTTTGSFLRAFGGDLPQPLCPWVGVGVDKADRIIVADKDNHRVVMFDRQGRFLMTLLENTIENDLDLRPYSVKVNPEGHLLVLLRGLPGTCYAKVHIYLMTEDTTAPPGGEVACPPPGGWEKRQPTAPPTEDPPPDEPPPSYKSVLAGSPTGAGSSYWHLY